MIYFDSSVIVALYVDEAHSSIAKRARNMGKLFTSSASYAEVRAALAAMQRAKRLDFEQHNDLVAEFNSDWTRFSTLEVNDGLATFAGELAFFYGLRGYDSIQLASALELNRSFSLEFLTFDRKLEIAAQNAGLSIFS